MSSDTRTSTSISRNDPNRTRSNSTVANWKKQKYKQYQPQFLHQTIDNHIPLPSVECFQLDYILNNVLNDESEQVIDDLLNVTANYQQDLRKEIKHKLSTEQKIQYKNITIGKEVIKINLIIHQRRKKLKKALASSGFGNFNDAYDEGEVNQLLRKSIEVSDRIKNSISRVRQFEEKHRPGRESLVSIKREKYPNLYNLVSKKNEMEHESPVNDEEVSAHSEGDDEVETEHVPRQDFQIEENEESQMESESPFLVKTEAPARQYPRANTNTHPPEEEDTMDPSEFELFMSNSIVKYREQQSKSLKTIKTEDQSINSSSTNYKSGGSPLKLLYSQLISNPKYLDQYQREQSASKYPFSSILSMKSAATIKSTQQSSHFKKLRINGSPLTSEHFRREKEKLLRNEQSEEEITAQMLDDLRLDQEMGVTDENEDVWNSSGMNTEDEDADLGNRVDDNVSHSNETSSLSSSELDTSDSDSSTDLTNTHLASNYYTNLKNDVKQKRHHHRIKKSAHRRKARLQVKEMSPTPKHQPSHHTLKPKSSILKTRQTSPIKQRLNLQSRNLAIANEVYDREISALSEVNNAYGSKTDSFVSSYNACGTITLKHGHKAHVNHVQIDGDPVSDGEGSPRSISILKSFMQ